MYDCPNRAAERGLLHPIGELRPKHAPSGDCFQFLVGTIRIANQRTNRESRRRERRTRCPPQKTVRSGNEDGIHDSSRWYQSVA